MRKSYSFFVLVCLICQSMTEGKLGSDLRFTSSVGLFPSVFNLAENAEIFANATCGQYDSEVYCTLQGGINGREQCGVCLASSSEKGHPIELAVDQIDSSWWQSPSLLYGPDLNYVTITLDLKKVFQVGYILIKSGPSPRPGNWILERSINGQEWAPWQFFAESDQECWHIFGLEPRTGKPKYNFDEEVICTSYYSGIQPRENGEIHVSVVNGRPGANGPSRTLMDFTQARFIRLRLRGVRMVSSDKGMSFADLDEMKLRKYFYSIRDITVGGQCPCNGHAQECPVNSLTMDFSCKCEHNTCGVLCDQCCPMYNQKRWRPGKFITGNECEMCQCFGHADECFFDPEVESERGSLNAQGKNEGGGVCIGCRDNTTGVNCHLCKTGFYRPSGVSRFDPSPCVKCDCQTFGSTGLCYTDGELREEGHEPGDCICKGGYSGPKCTACARGFHQYPKCTQCKCNLAGTLNGECDGDCLCKENVQGERCDQCKPGYFALSEANLKGCLECFCNGITTTCEAATLGVEEIHQTEGWKATNLRGTKRVDPYWSTMTSGVTVAEEDLHQFGTYFWEAPKEYIGNKLPSYGQLFKVETSWHRGRGDTSGSFTRGPDIILQGEGMLIGVGLNDYPNTANTTISVNLIEANWYHIPDKIINIAASAFRSKEADFRGRRVYKQDFMRVLSNVERFLVRAKYHTDQLEGTLRSAMMEIGRKRSISIRKTWAVESCICPIGYEGLSCELCSFGFTRINDTLFSGECIKCDCNGHVMTCDPFSLKCGACLHNTEGEHCEKCKDGFYGNPLNGSPDDCKPCKCPLLTDSNNFSPACETAVSNYDKYSLNRKGYVCTQCPRGYEGDHCERCTSGYFGNPLKIGQFCQPCECNGNVNPFAPDWCDHRTGECLRCQNNTAGWNCDKCLTGYFGNPLKGACEPCNCNKFGAKGLMCDQRTGQCSCKSLYTGRTCSRCKDGFGNIKAGCRRCNCHEIGSRNNECDASTGQCTCFPGITGLTCETCIDNHYGFSSAGCKPCDCHPNGSKASICNEFSGQCLCRPNIIGLNCGKCEHGYWNINSGKGCQKCLCHRTGAVGTSCDEVSGQCSCKPGVGGTKCDACIAGYWGFSSFGCKKCKSCTKPGYICDLESGKCVCPKFTIGERCESCQIGAFDYDSKRGCKVCNCHTSGSLTRQCNTSSGKCKCKTGFQGEKCDRCASGYYNFPYCRACNCDGKGTTPSKCDANGVCDCNSYGTCSCKDNVEGRKCASCKPETFGLASDNDKGCFECFCFGRASSCKQASFFWNKISLKEPRHIVIVQGNSSLVETDGLLAIPFSTKSLQVGVQSLFMIPLYWTLHGSFLGDRIRSYNGYLKFMTTTNGHKPYSPGILEEHPLVQLKGNNRITLIYYPKTISFNGYYEVR